MESKRFSRKMEDFICEVCGKEVKGTGYTDHCPNCLWGKHVDVNPGDRQNKCGGMLKPIKAFGNRNNFEIEYVCERCGEHKRIKAGEDDSKELLFEMI